MIEVLTHGPGSVTLRGDCLAEGVVIGSALIEALTGAESVDSARAAVSAFLAPIRAAMDNIGP